MNDFLLRALIIGCCAAIVLLVLFAWPKKRAEAEQKIPTVVDEIPESRGRIVSGESPEPPAQKLPSVVRKTKALSREVSSTAYCLTGTMASGKRVYSGAVAMNNVPFGTRYRVLTGPATGRVLTVEDRIGHSSDFDIAFPGDCESARKYGRRQIRVEVVA